MLSNVIVDVTIPHCSFVFGQSRAKVSAGFPRGGKLTFSRCMGVENLTLAAIKMSNFPRSQRQGRTLYGFGG